MGRTHLLIEQWFSYIFAAFGCAFYLLAVLPWHSGSDSVDPLARTVSVAAYLILFFYPLYARIMHQVRPAMARFGIFFLLVTGVAAIHYALFSA